jgi:dipeptidyl-peptidase-4
MKSGGNFFLYDVERKKFSQLTDSDEEQMNVKFSPDGSRVGFVRADNLYVYDLATGTETQLTSDGGNHILNGRFDWVYEEEFSIIDGWQWSPDGQMIAYWQLDESRVPEFPILDFKPLHQEIQRTRYPKPGDPNSIVRIGVVSLSSKKTTWMDIGSPADSAQDIYVPRISWTAEKGKLIIQRLNRQQNTLDLYLADASTGNSHILFTETSKTWIEVEVSHFFLKTSGQFVWISERDGFSHLYLYDLKGTLIRQLTQGSWDVDRIAGVDEKNGLVYFIADVTSPLDRDIYSVRLDGGGFKRITSGSGTHGGNLAPDCSVLLHTFSDVRHPTRTSLMKNDGTEIRVLNEGGIPALSDYRVSYPEFFTFTTTDGLELNGWMIKPQDFDPSRKYPVFMDVYGGPGSQSVRNSWSGGNFYWYQLLAQKGYIIVGVDNRGTAGRGTAFKTAVYRNLGKWEAHDQIEAARHLGTLPFVDASRIGMWGWSYGGYTTLMSLLLGADVFKAGIAVAPVTHWKFYDTIYAERYMGTPADNPEGYEQSAPLTHAKELKGNLLLVHGTADDNVHWQNTVTMVGELIKEGRQFETAFYPGGMHGIGGGKIRAQLYTKLTNFILEKL